MYKQQRSLQALSNENPHSGIRKQNLLTVQFGIAGNAMQLNDYLDRICRLHSRTVTSWFFIVRIELLDNFIVLVTLR